MISRIVGETRVNEVKHYEISFDLWFVSIQGMHHKQDEEREIKLNSVSTGTTI